VFALSHKQIITLVAHHAELVILAVLQLLIDRLSSRFILAALEVNLYKFGVAVFMTWFDLVL